MIIAYAPLFTVSPNTDIKRTEENNHPTPNLYDDRAEYVFRPSAYTIQPKGHPSLLSFNVFLNLAILEQRTTA